MQRSFQKAFTLVELLTVIVIIGVLVALLLPAINSVRETTRKTQCQNNMKQIGLAINAYAEANQNQLPPSHFHRDPIGTPGGPPFNTSCLALLLPFLEEVGTFKQYDLKKDWNDTANAAAVNVNIGTFLCPAVPDSNRNSITDYSPDWDIQSHIIDEIKNSNPTWISSVPVNSPIWGVLAANKKRRVKEITDGMSKTYLFFECSGRPAVFLDNVAYTTINTARWADWQNGFATGALPLVNYTNCNEVFSFHAGGAMSVLCDGSVQFIKDDINHRIFCANFSYHGGDIGEIE